MIDKQLPMTENELREIEARLTKITPGPWQWEDADTLATTDSEVIGGAVLWAKDGEGYGASIQVTDEDRTFIAHAPDDMRRLYAEVIRLRAELKR